MLADQSLQPLSAFSHLDNAAICHLQPYGVIAVQGVNAQTFLQGQLTCDLRTLITAHSQLAAFCNGKGRIIASLRVWQVADGYHLLLPQDNIASTLTQLKKYAAFSKVTLSDLSETHMLIAWLGRNAAVDTPINPSATHVHCHLPLPTDIHHSLWLSPLATGSALWQQLLQQALPAPAALWQLHEILAKQAQIYDASRELFTPHDLDYPALGAVSFSKGCYVGQEIIARMQHLGKPKKHLYRLTATLPELPTLGSNITQGDCTVGQLVNACYDTTAQVQCLAVIQDSAYQAGDLRLHGHVLQTINLSV